MSVLFSSTRLGNLSLASRIVMAPMTRNRSPEHVPDDLVVEYYRQRSQAGLIITEGTAPNADGAGYARIPGIYNDAQQAAWHKVTSAVHQGATKIFVQLMHTGRASHPDNLPQGARVVAPSPIAVSGTIFTDTAGPQPYPVPVEMTEADITQAIQDYVSASQRAIAADFDGVELHGANGYLIDQFLHHGSNQRKDRWGGSIENRARFALEVAKATVAAIGADRVGIRLSPYGQFNDMSVDEDTDELYRYLASEFDRLGLVYVHLVDHSSMGAQKPPAELVQDIRNRFSRTLILSGGYDKARAEADLTSGLADLVAFGRPFISNPDLSKRLAEGAPLAPPDFGTFYTPGPKGYTDYPTLTAG